MYASGLARWSRGTVWVVHVLLPRHSPMLRALLCALYTLSRCLSFSLSCYADSHFLRLALSSLRLFLLRSSIAAFRSLARLPVPSRSPVAWDDTHARMLFLSSSFSVVIPFSVSFLISPSLSFSSDCALLLFSPRRLSLPSSVRFSLYEVRAFCYAFKHTVSPVVVAGDLRARDGLLMHRHAVMKS